MPDYFKEPLTSYSIPDKLAVFLVDGKYVRDNIFPDFTEGGHSEVYNFIPATEIWIDFDISAEEIKAVLLHELHEYCLMLLEGMDYDTAHDAANVIEQEGRHNPDKVDELIQAELNKLR